MPDDKFDDFNPNNPYTALALLSARVETLGKEKEALERELEAEENERKDLEKRVAKMEKSFQRGAGMMIMLPIIGTAVGAAFAFAKILFGGGK